MTPWIADDARAVPRAGAIQLFCFAHAGGGPPFFRPWRAALAPEITVRPVVLPGRERRLAEPPYRSVTDLIGPLCDALEPHLTQPYAFFGHSMGAVVAYEAARRLAGGPAGGPACLLASGHAAPGLARRRTTLSALPDAQFAAAVSALNGTPAEILDEPELLALMLPALRADFELVESYQPLPGGELTCPVAAYLGTADPHVTKAEALAWRSVTTGEFSLRLFSGDHFYLRGGRPDVLGAVRADLRLAAERPPAAAAVAAPAC